MYAPLFIIMFVTYSFKLKIKNDNIIKPDRLVGYVTDQCFCSGKRTCRIVNDLVQITDGACIFLNETHTICPEDHQVNNIEYNGIFVFEGDRVPKSSSCDSCINGCSGAEHTCNTNEWGDRQQCYYGDCYTWCNKTGLVDGVEYCLHNWTFRSSIVIFIVEEYNCTLINCVLDV